MQRQQHFYEQTFPSVFFQPVMPPDDAYQIYPPHSISNSSQYNNYDQFIQSVPENFTTVPHRTERSTAKNSHRSSIHRSVKKSSRASNSALVYYCETCRIYCTDNVSYKAHVNGLKHKRKRVLEKNNANRSFKRDSHILRCDLCDIICSNSHDLNAHLDGNKHEKRMRIHRQLKEKEILNNTSTSNSDSHAFISQFEILQYDEQSIGEEYIEIIYDNMNKPILYHCHLCKCKFEYRKGQDMHLKDKRHRLLYQKKINRNSIVDNQINDQSQIDEDTTSLMMFDEQIIPSSKFLNMVEEFVTAVESALKSCSKQLQRSSIDNYQYPLIGVSRIGLLGKNLIIKDDFLFDIVVLCTEWPKRTIFQTTGEILLENFDDRWKDKIQIECQLNREIIELKTNTNEGIIRIIIRFTSLSIKEQEKYHSEEFLSEIHCLNALDSIYSTQWFQNQVSTRQYASILIRCLRYKTKISTKWKALSSEAIEILIDYALSQSRSAIHAFRTILECLSSGFILSNGLSLNIPWQTHSMNDIFANLTNQERNDITQEAQFGLRLMSFGQLAQWFE